MPPKRKNDTVIKEGIGYLLILTLITQTLYPLSLLSDTALLLFQFLYVGFVVAGIFLVRDSPVYLRGLIILGTLWVIAGAAFVLDSTNPLIQFAAFLAYGIYQAAVVGVLLRYIFHAKVVNRDILFAACVVYLLLGAIFVPVYGVIESITFAESGGTLHAFADPQTSPGEIIPWQHLVYYSYSTLTTLGYGDVLPITPAARSIASIEAIVGVLYLTIIMGRLVGLYAAREEIEE
ncbi:MAG: potassium channel family protein [Aggregatilineales bacterium]